MEYSKMARDKDRKDLEEIILYGNPKYPNQITFSPSHPLT
jgi:hypothetical protein